MTEIFGARSMEMARLRGNSRQIPFALGKVVLSSWPLLDALVIVGLSVLASLAYHLLVDGDVGPVADYAKLGLAIAFLRLLIQSALSDRRAYTRATFRFQFQVWTAAFASLIAIAFLAKISQDYSRGVLLTFYVSGLPLFLLWQSYWKRIVRKSFAGGSLTAHRVLLLGTPNKIENFLLRHRPSETGLEVKEMVHWHPEAMDETLSGQVLLREGVSRAIERVRLTSIDEVLVLLPWSATAAINTCTDMLMTTPTRVRLGPESVFNRFSEAPLERLGSVTTLKLVRPPLTKTEVILKRAFDIAVSLALLVLTLPLVLIVSILIKFDSPGPVLFRQRRLGFNQQSFEIYKLRTMAADHPEDGVVQASRNDPRVTRLGRFLRRWSIDELPQLLNVLRGDMSLVGPRPHALSHDQDFEQKVASYARRHNIKPGITGWAQVNGWRGPTDTQDKIQARVDHDLYYVDNWSLLLDLYILALTLFSPKAHQHAY